MNPTVLKTKTNQHPNFHIREQHQLARRPLSYNQQRIYKCTATNEHTTTTTTTNSKPLANSSSNNNNTKEEQSAAPVVQLLVSAATETLRLLSQLGGKPTTTTLQTQQQQQLENSSVVVVEPYAQGDVKAVLTALKQDFDSAYFVTGILTEAAYDEDCYFADPTVKFQGRDLWKQNLQLLVPFLIEPVIELYSLKQLQPPPPPTTTTTLDGNIDKQDVYGDEKEEVVVLYAEWRLTTGLKLPWKPYIDVLGNTTYTLAYPDSNRIIKHVEAWNIDGFEAVKMVLSPGRKQGK